MGPAPSPCSKESGACHWLRALAAAAGRASGARGHRSGLPASDLHAEQERQAGRRTVAVPEEELITPVSQQ